MLAGGGGATHPQWCINMDWRWNGLFKGIDDAQIPKAYFIHFFLKDLLPQRGENVADLMKVIN